MLNRFRNASKSTSYRPTVEALENRLVPSASAIRPTQEVMPLPPLVGLTQENNLGPQVETLIRLRRVVQGAEEITVTKTQDSLTSCDMVKGEFLTTLDGGTSPVDRISFARPTESVSLNF